MKISLIIESVPVLKRVSLLEIQHSTHDPLIPFIESNDRKGWESASLSLQDKDVV